MDIFSDDNSCDAIEESLQTQKVEQSHEDAARHVTLPRRTDGPRFQPIRLHAKGGLGEVFLARDTELDRDVALKEIKGEHAKDLGCQSRFIAEAMVTGALDHPGIVPVYGLGQYDDGRPYYAMRFVSGNSFKQEITAFYKETTAPKASFYQGREYRKWLRRLIDCCNAMQYAHEHGILHRDLKPDNVMLGRHGETLVVDWGLAKTYLSGTTDEDEIDASDNSVIRLQSGLQTSLGRTLGTPMYMSPEQAMGLHNQLTPAADVYSLGAMLFNVSSGQNPIVGRNVEQVIENVRAGNIRDLHGAMPTVPRTIVSICRKAMQKDPRDRYQTTIDMADDLDRWLSDEPVLAHRDAETYSEKLGRWIRRHRSWTVSATAALVVIALISVAASFLINLARKAEEAAKLQANIHKAEAIARYDQSLQAIDTWLVQSEGVLKHLPEAQSLRGKLLELANEDFAKLASQHSDDAELNMMAANAQIRRGNLNQLQQNYGEARDSYDAAIKRLRSPEFAGPIGSPEGKLTLAGRALLDIAKAQTRIGVTWDKEMRFDKASRVYQSAIQTLTQITEVSSQDEVKRAFAATLVNASGLARKCSDHSKAIRQCDLAIAFVKQLANPLQTPDQLLLAKAEEALGRCYSDLGQNIEAASQFNSALQRLDAIADDPQLKLERMETVASVLASGMRTHRNLGNTAAEDNFQQRATIVAEQLVNELPQSVDYQQLQAASYINSGLFYFGQDKCPIAHELISKTNEFVNLHDQVQRDDAPMVLLVAEHLDVLGQIESSLGNREVAVRCLKSCIDNFQFLVERLSEQENTPYRLGLAIALSHLSQIGDVQSSNENYLKAIKILEDVIAESSDETLSNSHMYQSHLGYIHFEYGRTAEKRGAKNASIYFAKARAIWNDDVQLDPLTSQRLAWLLATCNSHDVRDPKKAVALAKKCLANAPENPAFIATLVVSLLANNDIDQAAEFLRGFPPFQPEEPVRLTFARAVVFRAIDDAANAEIYSRAAIEKMSKQAPFNRDLVYLKSLCVDSRQ
ncbi:protein kinase domain-containing protein [Novipirellula sp. SH528]|uniref:protein kinase domain-containing protein n=1 Tax=Novipirellula sp. SH528 TaxID=3454466 RepID=UPI003FA06B0B